MFLSQNDIPPSHLSIVWPSFNPLSFAINKSRCPLPDESQMLSGTNARTSSTASINRRISPSRRSWRSCNMSTALQQGTNDERFIYWLMKAHQVRHSYEQYRRKLKTWGWDKNLSSAENVWRFVDDRIKKRSLQGKVSDVVIRGEVIPLRKIKKEISRHVRPDMRSLLQSGSSHDSHHVLSTWRLELITHSAPSTPDGGNVVVQTPYDIPISTVSSPAVPFQKRVTWNQLPWLQFEKLIMTQCTC